MDSNTQFIVDGAINTPAVILYFSDLILRGITSGIGKDIWEQVKKKATLKSEHNIVNEFIKNPKDLRNSSKIEAALENWIENDSQFNDSILEAFAKNKNLINKELISTQQLKNIVNSSTITVNTGNVHIGDK